MYRNFNELFMKPCIIIPARIASSRLPNKVLADINGKPMILRVFENCMKSEIKNVFVATDSIEVKNIIESIGGRAFLTESKLPSGTDRVFSALKQFNAEDDFDAIINVQGDVPNISSDIISQTFNLLNQEKNSDITTAVVKFENEEKAQNPNAVKAILSMRGADFGKALYFTRSKAPFGKGDLLEHIGTYAYKRTALEKFVSLPQSTLEKRESLEQLRAIENDMTIFAKIVNFKPISIDTFDDLELARSRIF